LSPDRFQALQKNFAPVTTDQRAESAVADAACSDLRAQIAEAGFGEAHVVGDDLKNILIGLGTAIKLQRTKLQPFFINFSRAAEAEADPCAADIPLLCRVALFKRFPALPPLSS
jgi:hypothetical protein